MKYPKLKKVLRTLPECNEVIIYSGDHSVIVTPDEMRRWKKSMPFFCKPDKDAMYHKAYTLDNSYVQSIHVSDSPETQGDICLDIVRKDEVQ